MWKQESSLRLVRSISVLLVLAGAVVVLQTEAGAVKPPLPNCTLTPDGLWKCGTEQGDCFHTCDVQFYNPPPNLGSTGCADTCCVRQPDGSYDCSSCPGCQDTYRTCVESCFSNQGGFLGCINPSRCARQASWSYKTCIITAPAYGCLTPDGSVDQDCCDNAGGASQVNCCYP